MTLKLTRTNTILYCQNWRIVVKFYSEVLGLSGNWLSDWFVEFQLTADSYLSVADERRATIKSAEGKGITLSWQVEDVQAVHNTLKQKGVKVSEIKQKWGSIVFYIHDPEGNRIEFWGAA